MQRYAGELAATAGPKDYAGQLRAIYNDLVRKRWRYVMEPGERVPGTPRALFRYVLGTRYNGCDDAERCDVLARTWRHRGFGDCDDVSTLVGAAALSIGMQPVWRVTTWPGGAHVSTTVRTPDGQWVSVDPVGHPEHGFGWALDPGPGGNVQHFDLEGRPVAGVPFRTATHAPLGALPVNAQTMPPTLMMMPRAGVTDRLRTHVVLTAPGDRRGARVLSMPLWSARVFRRGAVIPHQRAVDQFGDEYTYRAGIDSWVPVSGYVVVGPSTAAERYAFSGFGRPSRWARRRKARQAKRAARRSARRERRQVRRTARRQKWVARRKKVARFFRRLNNSQIAQAFRKFKAKALRSPLVKQSLSSLLAAFGVPPQVSKGVLEREAALADAGGRSRLAALVAEGKYKEAAGMVAKSVGAGVRGGVQAMVKPFGGYSALSDAQFTGQNYQMQQGGRVWHASPVAVFSGCPYAYNLGQTEVQEMPTPGHWFRPEKGDTFLGVVGDAFGVSGGARLKQAQIIARAPENAYSLRAPSNDFERKYFPGGLPSLTPKFSCDGVDRRADGGGCYPLLWLAPADGVRAPEAAPAPGDTTSPAPEPAPVPIPTPAPTMPAPPSSTQEPAPTGPTHQPPPNQTCPEGTGWKWVEPFLDPTTQKVIPGDWVCSIAPSTIPVPQTPEDEDDVPPAPVDDLPDDDPEPLGPIAEPTEPEPPPTYPPEPAPPETGEDDDLPDVDDEPQGPPIVVAPIVPTGPGPLQPIPPVGPGPAHTPPSGGLSWPWLLAAAWALM